MKVTFLVYPTDWLDTCRFDSVRGTRIPTIGIGSVVAVELVMNFLEVFENGIAKYNRVRRDAYELVSLSRGSNFYWFKGKLERITHPYGEKAIIAAFVESEVPLVVAGPKHPWEPVRLKRGEVVGGLGHLVGHLSGARYSGSKPVKARVARLKILPRPGQVDESGFRLMTLETSPLRHTRERDN